MHKILSWYNQNRRRIWVAIFAFLVIAMIWWTLVNYSGEGSSKIQTNTPTQQHVDTNTLNSITMTTEKSAVTGQEADISQDNITTLDNFIAYCNSGKINEAYSLISDECKDEMYSSVSDFQELYWKPVFGSGKKTVSVENWTGKIYKVTFKEDFLSTGKYTEENNLQDYITIVQDKESNTKLNINKYIKRTEMEKTAQTDGIEIKIVKKDTYMDYEYYTFEVKNNLEKYIALGNKQDLEASYLKDENDLQYKAYMFELTQQQMILSAKQTKLIRIKYFNDYSSTRRIKELVFPRVVVNYNEGNQAKYTTIKFDL